jgi:uncharacterized protein (DUF1499 family)
MESNTPSKTALRLQKITIALFLLLPLGALGTKFGLWPFTAGLSLFALSVLGSIVILVINLIWNFRKPGSANRKIILITSIIALVPLEVALLAMRNSAGGPIIHDISTDLNSPPEFIAGKIHRGTNSNPLQRTEDDLRIQQEIYSDIKPIISPLTSDEAFKKAMVVSRQLGWEIYAEVPTEGRIEAVDTTFWFGFKDDIVIRVQSENQGSRIDLRSVSRVGSGDLGANAKRISSFVEAFEE